MPKRLFKLTNCPHCGKSRFIACKVSLPTGEMWYVECDHTRAGCGASSGWYTELFYDESVEMNIVDEMDFGHPINAGK